MSGAPVITIASSPWGRRVEVAVEPPRIGHPLRSFASRADAVAHAARLAEAEGWQVRDLAGRE